jgi:hypothetical protein
MVTPTRIFAEASADARTRCVLRLITYRYARCLIYSASAYQLLPLLSFLSSSTLLFRNSDTQHHSDREEGTDLTYLSSAGAVRATKSGHLTIPEQA